MGQPSMNQLLVRYVPVLTGLVAAAIFVATVPSKPANVSATGSAASGFELPDTPGTAQSGASGASGGSDASSAPAASAPTGAATNADSSVPSRATPSRSGTSGTSVDEPEAQSSSSAPAATGSSQDCSRNEIQHGPTCRPTPPFTGDNGGATDERVTRDEVRIVYYLPKRNEQVQAILEANGGATAAQQQHVAETYEQYFNDAFETWGRSVDIVFQEGPGGGADPAEAQADATKAVVENRAFVVGCSSCIPAFHEELVRRGVPSFTTITPYTEDFYNDNAPLFYGVLPDFDLTARHAAEYYCKRLTGKRAQYAGDPQLRAQERALGIIAIESADKIHERFQSYVESCGGKVAGTVVYASDVATAQQQATNAILQMRQDGANIVTCLCDPVAPLFFTSAATQQGYNPEWFQNGLFGTDSVKAGRAYDQSQWSRAFGVTSLTPDTLLAETPWYTSYKAGGGTDERAIQNSGAHQWNVYFSVFTALELAGPDLTVESFTNALLTTPAFGGDRYGSARNSFGRAGPSPFTRVDDFGEVWWDAARSGPDGRLGYQHYVEGGQRRMLGEWPSTDPSVFVDDGSQQPPASDPDRV